MKIKLKCKICGENYKKYPSQLKSGQGRNYCSAECSLKARRQGLYKVSPKKKGKYIKCLICSKKIWAEPNEIKRGKKYCSKECLGIANGNRMRGKKAPWIGKPAKERICLICGKRFKFYESPTKKNIRNIGFCCSRKCADKWHSIKMHKSITLLDIHCFTLELIIKLYKKANRKMNIKYKCDYCGQYFLLKYLRPNRDKHFCSVDCNRLWRSKHYSGEHNPMYGIRLQGELSPNWQGGLSFEPYGIEFNNELKSKIRARDNNQCQLPRCGIYENGKRHSVHHIDYCKQNNEPENLITLCKSCHVKTNYNRKYWQSYFTNKLNYLMEVDYGTNYQETKAC